MASIERRRRRDGTYRYDVRFRSPSGEHRKQTFATRKEAEAAARRVEVEKDRGVWVDPRCGRITFGEWVKLHQATAEHSKRPTTHARDEAVLRRHFLPRLEHRSLASITPADIQGIVNAMSAKLAPSTVRTNYGVVQPVFRAAVDADVIGRSPCRGIKLPAHERVRPIRFLTASELGRLAQAMPIEYAPMVYLAGVLGLRWSEVIALRVSRVNILRRTVEVAETFAEVHGLVVEAPVKTQAARRIIEMPPFVAALLADHMARFGLTAVDDSALLFTAPDGGPLLRSNFRTRVWYPAREAARLHGLTFHHLRHSAVGYLIDAGAHPAVMQRRIGHSSIRVTLDVYGHVLPTTDQAATAHLEAMFRPSEEIDASNIRELRSNS
jgi:integrase